VTHPGIDIPAERLTPGEWRARQEAHRARLAPFVEAQAARRSRQEKHPVLDFLFEYYSFRITHLLRWSPGAHRYGEPGADEPLAPPFRTGERGHGLYPEDYAKRDGLERRARLLRSTQDRPPFFGCLGLHEWAMVYEAADIRHGQLPLRLSHPETRRVVESFPVRCTHYDAFRFFSASARPLNQVQPLAETRDELEQPGCIHANMDLYRFAFKLFPWIPAELLADTFELALRAREIDMRASPYDISSLGYTPLRIETSEGQAEYRLRQREIASEARLLRSRLLDEMDRLLALTKPPSAGEHAGLSP
jgi:hypothetical protein